MLVLSCGDNISKNNREKKGLSLICFPNTFCVVDIETTGRSPVWDEIIEIGAIRYCDGKEVERFNSLIQPSIKNDGTYVDEFITDLTGITNSDLEEAPKATLVISDFFRFLGDDIIVGYNVNFDINFLYDAFEKTINLPLSNNYVDVMRLAKKLHPDLPHHRLKDILEIYGIENERAHRAISDVIATKSCYDALHDKAISQFSTETAFIDSFKRKYKFYGQNVRAADIIGDSTKQDPDSPLYNRYCVFTGKLEKYSREEAMQLVADMGGINEDRVTQRTNYLVLGNNDYCTSIKDGKSNKQKQAERYKIKGQDIEIIPEAVFYDMINDYLSGINSINEDMCICSVSDDWVENIKRMLDTIVIKRGLPDKSLFLEENKSQKDSERTIGYTVYIWEPSYPPISHEKQSKNKNVCTINLSTVKARPNELTLFIRNNQARGLKGILPSDAIMMPYTKSDIDTGTTRIRINYTSENLVPFIEANVSYCIDNYVSKESSFGCCSRYEKCSDKGKCVHENLLYSKACAYRSNLEQGRIFYGKNRNVD